MPGSRLPAIAFVALILFAHTVVASPDVPVAIDVGIVVASNEGTTMDPALSSIQNKLKSMFNYSSYRMVDRVVRTLSVGETGDFGLPGNRSMRATPVPAKGNKLRLAVQIMEGDRNLLSTTLGLTRGGMVLVGGPSYQKGVLILIISAE
ncbi:MAG: hypothetical protein HKM29_04660 [Deltaproteobacteria bacterium]|nr:hypothetical protein [Deltaproteobacteria bacterium]NNG46097.1 hypothetical protein [Deltaproteobacteria bacterium]